VDIESTPPFTLLSFGFAFLAAELAWRDALARIAPALAIECPCPAIFFWTDLKDMLHLLQV
jgi:hypothetical protein